MKTNLSNFRWIVLPLILLTFAVGNVRADGNDLSITAPIAADSVVVAPDTVQSTISWSDKFDEMLDNHHFIFGVIASSLAAIITLLLFFCVLRPKVKIYPRVAVLQKGNGVVSFQILFSNKWLCSCNDLRISLFNIIEDKNGDGTKIPLNNIPFNVLTLKGGLLDKHNSDFCLTLTNKNSDELPNKLAVSVISQHAVSGIVTGEENIFGSNDYVKGKFVKGILIPEGSNYKETIMRENAKTLKCVLWILATIYVLGIVWLFATSLTLCIKLLLTIGVFVSVAISIIIWQLIVQTKANSVNNSKNIHISSNTQVIEIHHHAEQPKPSASEGVEEVPFEEVTDDDKNTKKPLK